MREINRKQEQKGWATLRAMDRVLGVIEPLRRDLAAETIPEEIQTLVDRREKAREGGEFNEADRLREEIEKQGYKIEDTAGIPRVIKL